MLSSSWQLTNPIDAIIFDCDGTLSKIEGIDELALSNDVYNIVQKLTQEAMGKSGMNPSIYSQRLQLVNPTLDRIMALGDSYIHHHTPDIREVINVLRTLKKPVYIVSAGILQAVILFARWLGIPDENVFAVNLYFDEVGKFMDYDKNSSLTARNGKKIIVDILKKKHTRLGYIGDGSNDYEVYHDVTRFIGYGGAFFRSHFAKISEFYIKTKSLTPILPLLLTQIEYEKLDPPNCSIYDKGVNYIVNEEVLIR